MAKSEHINSDTQGALVATLIEEEGNWEKTKKRFSEVSPDALDKGFEGFAFFTAEKQAGIKIPDHAKEAVEAYRKQVKLSAANKAAKVAAFEAGGGSTREGAADPLK